MDTRTTATKEDIEESLLLSLVSIQPSLTSEQIWSAYRNLYPILLSTSFASQDANHYCVSSNIPPSSCMSNSRTNEGTVEKSFDVLPLPLLVRVQYISMKRAIMKLRASFRALKSNIDIEYQKRQILNILVTWWENKILCLFQRSEQENKSMSEIQEAEEELAHILQDLPSFFFEIDFDCFFQSNSLIGVANRSQNNNAVSPLSLLDFNRSFSLNFDKNLYHEAIKKHQQVLLVYLLEELTKLILLEYNLHLIKPENSVECNVSLTPPLFPSLSWKTICKCLGTLVKGFHTLKTQMEEIEQREEGERPRGRESL